MKTKKGFTLVELMIVVVILGILAAIAIPLYMKFVQQSKVSEAKVNLGKIGTLSEEYYAKSGVEAASAAVVTGTMTALISRFPIAPLCASAAPHTNTQSVPTAIAAVQNVKYQAQEGDWTNATTPTAWQQMHFAIAQPIQYLYCYGSTGSATTAAFTTWATGDLDGDSIYSSFWRIGTIVAGKPTVGVVATLNDDE